MFATPTLHCPPDRERSACAFGQGWRDRSWVSRRAELTEKIVALEDLWGQRARDLEGRPESELSGLTLATALIAPPAPDLVRRAIEALVEAHGAIDPGLGSRAGRDEPAPVPPPMFEESGLAPKHLCRILRFRHACELAMSRGSGWGAIAADAGYSIKRI